MSPVSEQLRHFYIQRAENCCEYCGLSQKRQKATFHVDHVIPIAAGGETVSKNLALAYVSHSLRKSARETAIDPLSGEEVLLYHPRKDHWEDHFHWDDVYRGGLTSSGRATVRALQMNRALIVAVRREEVHRERHPTIPIDNQNQH